MNIFYIKIMHNASLRKINLMKLMNIMNNQTESIKWISKNIEKLMIMRVKYFW